MKAVKGQGRQQNTFCLEQVLQVCDCFHQLIVKEKRLCRNEELSRSTTKLPSQQEPALQPLATQEKQQMQGILPLSPSNLMESIFLSQQFSQGDLYLKGPGNKVNVMENEDQDIISTSHRRKATRKTLNCCSTTSQTQHSFLHGKWKYILINAKKNH